MWTLRSSRSSPYLRFRSVGRLEESRNYLVQLRTRSDYRDARIFLTGVTEPLEARAYHRAMCSVTCSTIALLETLTLAYGGREIYEAAYSRVKARFRTQSLETRASALLK